MKRSILVCVVAAVVSGCGGGGHSSVSIPTASIAIRNTGIGAEAIAYDAKRDLVYVTGASAGNVTIVSPATGAIAGEIPIKGYGGGLRISSDDGKLFVAQSGFIQRVDLTSHAVDQSFYISPMIQQYPGVPISLVGLRVQPGNSNVVACLISNSAGAPEPVWSVSLFTSGIQGSVLAAIFGIPVIYDLQFSTDGSTVYVALESGVEAIPIASGGTSGWVVQTPQPMWEPTDEARGKLYIGTTAYDERTNQAVGTFAVSTPTWVFAPEAAADRAVAFTCTASGGDPSLLLLDTNRFKTLWTYPLTGLPLVAGAGVGGLTVAGKRCAFLLINPKTQATTLAFIDATL